MPFFENTESVRSRNFATWSKGVEDFKGAPSGAKPLVVVSGGVGTVIGATWGVAKATGVSTYEYVDQSFGKSRSHGFFNYLVDAPILETLAWGILGAGAGAALNWLRLDSIPLFGIQTSFQAGLLAGLGTFVSRHFPKVWWASLSGGTGRGMTVGRDFADMLKAPLGKTPQVPAKDSGKPQ